MKNRAPASRPARIVLLAWLALAAGGCTGTSPTTTPPPSGDVIVAEIVSYQLVANQPGRLLVALLTGDNRWLSFGSVGMRFSYLGGASAAPSQAQASDVVAGPVTADFLAIPGSPEGIGRQPALTLPSDGRGVYAVESITLPKAGYWQVVADGHLADGSAFEATAAFEARDRSAVVSVGEEAPRSENPVIGTPGVEPAALDSRAAGGGTIPDQELHRTSIASAIAQGHPALVVFSTPVYCVSRFCGPVTDLVAELAAKYGDRADFIHVEIYRDFEAGEVSQTAQDWLLTDQGELREPWTFLIDANGRIAASWDTVVARAEIEPLLAGLPVK